MAVVLAVAPLPARLSRADADDLAAFRTQYPLAAAKLKAAYSHVKVTTEETRSGRNDDKPVFRSHCEYLREGNLLRKVEHFDYSTEPRLPSGSQQAAGGSAEKYFDTYRLAGRDKSAIKAFGPLSDERFREELCIGAPVIVGPYSIDSLDIVNILSSPNFRIISMGPGTVNGTSVLKLIVDQSDTLSPVQGSVDRLTLFFLKDSLALLKAVGTVGCTKATLDNPRQFLSYEMTYDEGDVPRIKTYHRWMTTFGKKSEDNVVSVTSLEFGPQDPKQFTLAALGIDEPGASTRRRVFWMLIVLGVICAAAGSFIYSAVRRKQTVAP